MSQAPDIASDQQPDCLPPRARYDLVGHEAAETAFANAWKEQRLHHAWLITGPRGIGKASFAWRAARRVLGAEAMPEYGPLGSRPDDPVCRTLEVDANPDMLVIRRPWDDKRKRWRAEITVDEARKATGFFEKSAGAGGWRVCLVDSADDMNTNAANALLKTLEEPPQRGILFLVSHSPGRLPATIRSRCRRLGLAPPAAEISADWLAEAAGQGGDRAARDALAVAGNAPGRALELIASGGLELHRTVSSYVASAVQARDSETRSLAERVSAKGQERLLSTFYDALAGSFQAQARKAAEAHQDPSAWIKAWKSLSRLVRDADALYLDPRQTALSALSLSRQAARQSRV